MEAEESSSLSSTPNPSAFLRDISNFKTPKPSSQNPPPHPPPSPFPLFFTASKQTPASSFRRCPPTVNASSNRSRKKATSRLQAFEIEQSQSSRKVQIRREKSLQTLEKSLAVWLNFLFQNPRSCGCISAVWTGEHSGSPDSTRPVANGKRESLQGGRFGVCGAWRSPKRQKNRSWRLSSVTDARALEPPLLSSLQVSLQDVCSLEDLKQRMAMYLATDKCKEVLCMMSQVAKNIDDGRLKMKGHCPIVADVGLKEKAVRILMCYNSTWLRTGLHIVFGGDSILPGDLTFEKVDDDSETEYLFLKMIIEKQFFSHAGLAKLYAYNKSVEGLYRPGYYEALGNLILKRFFLFVLALDKAKCHSALPAKYGIDGLDGGSPLLFCHHSSIKSSRQIIHEFLSEVMHGEGDLLAHLATMGYKVTHQQCPLSEYEFSATDLGKDFRDGVRLCRAIQLLQNESSILMKLVVPSDGRKKNLQNCGIAIQYLSQAGVPLIDEDGYLVVAEDIVNGDKELTISLLWNMFVHLQLPLLINKDLLLEEISRAKGQSTDGDYSISQTGTHMDMLLEWIQAICENYHIKVNSFTSLVDGKALCCLIDYYFRSGLQGYCFFKEAHDKSGDESFIFARDITVARHNIKLVQGVAKMLGNFPEVLQINDIVESDITCNERSVIILLTFLSSQLIGRKDLDQLNLQKLLGWSYSSPDVKCVATVHPAGCAGSIDPVQVHSNQKRRIPSFEALVYRDELNKYIRKDAVEKIKFIQSCWRAMKKRNDYLKIKVAASIIQKFARGYIVQKHISERVLLKLEETAAKVIQCHFRGSIKRRNFMKMKAAASFLQIVIRAWLRVTMKKFATNFDHNFFQQLSSGGKTSDIFESYLKCMTERRHFIRIQKSILLIQQAARTWISRRSQREKIEFPLREQEVLEQQREAAVKIQLAWRKLRMHEFFNKEYIAATKIQSYWRGWLMRRDFLCHKAGAIVIQSWVRCLICMKEFKQYMFAAIEIQRFVRGMIARNRLLGSPYFCGCNLRTDSHYPIRNSYVRNLELKILQHSVLKLQRWWRRVLLRKLRTRSAIIIQSHLRGWIARREFQTQKNRIIVIQSYWKGCIVRKDHYELRDKLLDLRSRMEKSAANVDNGMRLIDRLIVALDQLLSRKRITSILRTCETLDMATEHSQKCCETLVAAGAIDTLLKEILTLTRSTPDQAVLKHSLSTLRNLARYPHLAEMLIDTPGLVETVFRELLRNKEAYSIAAELLRRLCLVNKGVDTLYNHPLLIKKLHSLVKELERKEKRNDRLAICTNKQRLKEASQLLHLIIKVKKS